MLKTLSSLALLVAAGAALAGAQEDPPAQSRFRRANGTLVVKSTAGSIPWSGEPLVRSTEPGERYHYLWAPELLASARAAAYVDADLPQGFRLGSNVGPPGSPMVAKAPARLIDFDGLNRSTAGRLGASFFPPDTIVAASPTKVLEGTNVALRLTTRTGFEVDSIPLNNFFGFAGSVLFDPKVYFDRLSERFFVVALEQSLDPDLSGIWLGVSKSSDPAVLLAPDEFCTYRIQGRREGSWADYPGIGINENWFAVAVNNFAFADGSFRRVQIYLTRVSQVTDNAESCPALAIKRFAPPTDAQGRTAFSVHPAQHYTTTDLPGKPLFMVSGSSFLPESYYTLWRIITDAGGQPRISKQTIEGDFSYFFPPLAPQRDGALLDTGDTRITQVAFRDGTVWAAHATACGIGPLPNESCVRAVGITPSADSAAFTFGEAFGRPNMFMFWPGIAVNKNGDLMMAFQRAVPQGFMGVTFNGKRANALHFDGIRNLRGSSCPLDNFSVNLGANRTGDYVGLQTDPLDDVSFWVAGEYTSQIDPLMGCDWKTRIGRARYN
ncbi:MAG: hypothetical protein OES32_02210 [Acidobacteriota bacterium]|nr:hypothetical protein [Acidobacteriota bacterium]MDH3522374.1 hypothetical protein [Acidobacteriota bacterium]